MTLQTVSGQTGVDDAKQIPTGWDWKASYVENLRYYNGDDSQSSGVGYELFSQQSVTPDTSLILAGPPTVDEGFVQSLSPLGLVTNINFNSDVGLRPIWEIGTNKTYFSRGKATHQMQIGAMVANKPSLMKLMTRQSPQDSSTQWQKDMSTGQFWANLDTETMSKPFGILLIFKTKGGATSYNGLGSTGDLVGSIYLENCNIANFSWNLGAQEVVMQENVTIMFDRAVSVDIY